jgi:MFS family permease
LKKTGDVRRARRTVIVFGFLSPLVFLVPLFMGPSVTVAAICLTMALFLSELMTAPLWAVAMDLAPRHAATSAGIMNTGLALAGAISPPLVGWIIDHSETWHPVFGLTMFFLCLGPILAIWIRPDRPYMGEPEPVELPVGGGVAVSS